VSGITIGSNISALRATRKVAEATSALGRTFERLSSGQRINRASDDAAGLAIAESLKANSRVYTQGIRNFNDGLSLLSIADGAVEQLSGITTKLSELAAQAANGTYSSTQRKALDAEAQALSKEFFRIARATEFNGVSLFDGDLAQLRLQGGYGVEGGITSGLGGALGTGSFGAGASYVTESYASYAVALGDLNGDGIVDLVTAGASDSSDGYATIRLGVGNGSFGTATSFAMEAGIFSFGLALGDLNGDGILDLVTAGQSDSADGYATIRLGTGNGSFGAATSYATEGILSRSVSLGDLNGDGILDLVTAGLSDSFDGYASIRLGVGNGTFGVATSYAAESSISQAVSLGDLNGDGILDLVTAGATGLFTSDGYATIRLGAGNGTFGAATSYAMETFSSYSLSLADLNGDGILDLVTAGQDESSGGRATIRLGVGNGSFGTATSYAMESLISRSVSLGDLNGDGILDQGDCAMLGNMA
jgi:flagellin-like hook-associated protein FlgL